VAGGAPAAVRRPEPPEPRRAAVAGSLAEAISALQHRYGSGAVRRGSDPAPAGAWPTGFPALDEVLVPGGLPAGRISVVAGRRRGGGVGGTGRLTLLQALLAVASRSMQVAYVDLPGTLDPGYLADLGADLDSCLVVRPPRAAAGAGLAMARTLVRAGVPWVGVVFGAGRVPATAWEHPLTALVEAVWGARAVACIAAPTPLAAPLAYASSLTLGCTPLGWQEVHGDVVGLRVRVEVDKSRVGAPGAGVSLLLRYPRPHAVGDVVGLPTLLPGHLGGEGEVAHAVAPAGVVAPVAAAG
jgi:recA bacterial DNA recombination protein